jgi:hypothetical protein
MITEVLSFFLGGSAQALNELRRDGLGFGIFNLFLDIDIVFLRPHYVGLILVQIVVEVLKV